MCTCNRDTLHGVRNTIDLRLIQLQSVITLFNFDPNQTTHDRRIIRDKEEKVNTYPNLIKCALTFLQQIKVTYAIGIWVKQVIQWRWKLRLLADWNEV